MGCLFFKAFISSANIHCQNIETNTPFQWHDQVFVSNSMPWRRDSLKLLKSWLLSHTQQIFHLAIIPNLRTPCQMFLFPDLW